MKKLNEELKIDNNLYWLIGVLVVLGLTIVFGIAFASSVQYVSPSEATKLLITSIEEDPDGVYIYHQSVCSKGDIAYFDSQIRILNELNNSTSSSGVGLNHDCDSNDATMLDIGSASLTQDRYFSRVFCGGLNSPANCGSNNVWDYKVVVHYEHETGRITAGAGDYVYELVETLASLAPSIKINYIGQDGTDVVLSWSFHQNSSKLTATSSILYTIESIRSSDTDWFLHATSTDIIFPASYHIPPNYTINIPKSEFTSEAYNTIRITATGYQFPVISAEEEFFLSTEYFAFLSDILPVWGKRWLDQFGRSIAGFVNGFLDFFKARFPFSWISETLIIIQEARVGSQGEYPSLDLKVSALNFEVDMFPAEAIMSDDTPINGTAQIITTFRGIFVVLLWAGFVFVIINRARYHAQLLGTMDKT